MTTIMFLGPCASPDAERRRPFPAFSAATKEGRFLREAVSRARRPKNVTIAYANVIPRPMRDDQGAGRDPRPNELMSGLLMHPLWEMAETDIVVVLGDAVRDAVARAKTDRLARKMKAGPRIRVLEHPSIAMDRTGVARTGYTAGVRRIFDDAVGLPSGA